MPTEDQKRTSLHDAPDVAPAAVKLASDIAKIDLTKFQFRMGAFFVLLGVILFVGGNVSAIARHLEPGFSAYLVALTVALFLIGAGMCGKEVASALSSAFSNGTDPEKPRQLLPAPSEDGPKEASDVIHIDEKITPVALLSRLSIGSWATILAVLGTVAAAGLSIGEAVGGDGDSWVSKTQRRTYQQGPIGGTNSDHACRIYPPSSFNEICGRLVPQGARAVQGTYLSGGDRRGGTCVCHPKTQGSQDIECTSDHLLECTWEERTPASDFWASLREVLD